MPLPELNTSGVNVSDTLFKLHQMRQQEDAAKALASVRENENALRIYELNQKKKEDERKSYDDTAKAVGWIASAEGDPALMESNYNKVKSIFESEGKPGMPNASYFYTNGAFDVSKFKVYAQNVNDTINKVRNPIEGTKFDQQIANPNYDAAKPEGPLNPKVVKVHMKIENGKAVKLEGTEPEPMLDPFTKFDLNQAQFAETKRHNKQTEAHAAEGTKIAKKNADRLDKNSKTAKKVAYRDTYNGAIYYYNPENPQDQKTLQKFGKQLVPVNQSTDIPIVNPTGTTQYERKIVNGKTYEKREDGWYEVNS